MSAPAAAAESGSTLVRRHEAAATAPARGTLIALHADGADLDALAELLRAAAPGWDRVLLQAPRARNPVLSSGHGPAAWGVYRGYAWYRGDDFRRPEPASFGDALWQLEQVVREHAAAGPVVVAGHREGAVLALAAVALLPGLLAGVVALDGDLPTIPGLDLRLAADRTPPLVWIEAGSEPASAAPLVARWLHHLEETI